MTFADRANAAQRHLKGGRCTAGLLIEGLDPAYRAEVLTALRDQTIYASTIASLLAEDGHVIASETLNRHRRGRCNCA